MRYHCCRVIFWGCINASPSYYAHWAVKGFIPMKVNGIEGLSHEEMQSLVQQGAKFVMYEYAISILIMTFKRSSDVYFVKADENAIVKGLGFTAISLLFGWWGFPWGPIYTIGSVVNNLRGGKDVTQYYLEQAA